MAASNRRALGTVAKLGLKRIMQAIVSPQKAVRVPALVLGLFASLSAVGGSSELAVGNATATVTGTSSQILNFPVVTLGDSSYDRYLSYSTGDVGDTAIAGTDYTAATGVLKIPTGATSANVPVTIAGSNATGAQASKTFSLLLPGASGTGPTPTFSTQTPITFTAASACTPDLNRDGRADLVFFPITNTGIGIRLNQTTPGSAIASFGPQVLIGAAQIPNISSCRVADVNNDGRADVIYAAGTLLHVLVNKVGLGASSVTAADFSDQSILGVSNRSAVLVDFNGDGRPDVASSFAGGVRVKLNETAIGSVNLNFPLNEWDYLTESTGSGGIQAADLNGDGRIDLAVVDSDSNAVAVMLNQLTPGANSLNASSFSVPLSFATVGSISGSEVIQIRDMDGDGRPDLIVRTEQNIELFINQLSPGVATLSAMSFSAPIVLDVADNFSGLASLQLADLNGDGNPELITLSGSGVERVLVLPNRKSEGGALSAASFGTALSFNPLGSVRHLSTADFNLDGKPDLLTVNSGPGTWSVLMNTTPNVTALPGFAASPLISGLTRAGGTVAADFNGDGKIDLASINSSGINIAFNTTAAGAAQASYATPINVPVTGLPGGTPVLAAGDFNMDGRPDLVTALGTGTGPVRVLINTGVVGALDASGAQFEQTNVTSGAALAGQSVAADFNLDGKLDLSFKTFNNKILLLSNTSDGSSTASFASAGSTNTTRTTTVQAVADFDGDGKPDIAALTFTGGSTQAVYMLANTTSPGSASFTFAETPTSPIDIGIGPTDLVAADFDGDGRMDLAAPNFNSHDIVFLLNTTTAGNPITFSAAVSVPVNPFSSGPMIVGDFDGDGRADLALSNGGGPAKVNVLLNRSTVGSLSFNSAALTALPGSEVAADLVSADFNNDGRLDFVVAMGSDGTLNPYLNTQFRVARTPATVTGTIAYNLPAALSANSTQLNFGTQATGVNSAPLSLSITDYSGTAGTFTITTGSNPGDFAASGSTCNGSNNPCTVSVRFNPGANGARSAILHYSSAAGSLDIPLSGSGASLAFSSVEAGTATTQSYTISNNSNNAVSLMNFLSTGADFRVVSTDCMLMLAAHSQCNVNLEFSPGDAGSSSGTLTYAADGNAQGVALSGAATAALITAQTANGSSSAAGARGDISADGRYMVFSSAATDLTIGQIDANAGEDVFLYDRDTKKTRLISDTGDGKTTSQFGAGGPQISANGRYIAFVSNSSALRPGFSNDSGLYQLYLYDRLDASLRMVSYAGNSMTASNGDIRGFALSADGMHIVFGSSATDLGVPGLVATAQTGADIIFRQNYYLYNVADGSLKLVNHTGTPQQNLLQNLPPFSSNFDEPEISADGAWVVFNSFPGNLGVPGLVTGGNPGRKQTFVYRVSDGSLRLVSHTSNLTTTANNQSEGMLAISADGSNIVFASAANNLGVPGLSDSGFSQDLFLYKRSDQSLQLISHSAASSTEAGNDVSLSPVISADGQRIAYESTSTNLVAGQVDSNGSFDVFLFDATTGNNKLVSRVSGGSTVTTGNAYARGPSISADGSALSLYSGATDLVQGFGKRNGANDVDLYVYDVASDSLALVTHVPGSTTLGGNSGVQSDFTPISADGQWLMLTTTATNLETSVSDLNNDFDVAAYSKATGINKYISLHVQTPPAAIELTPGSLSFADQALDLTSTAQTVTIKNSGGAALILGTLSLTGAHANQFALAADSCSSQTLVSDQTCEVSVTFKPTTTAAKTASLSVPSNLPTATVSLSGTGIIPVSANMNALGFGSQVVSTAATPKTVTITDANRQNVQISVTGTNGTPNTDFSAASCVAVNSTTCTISVGFNPSSAGSRTATLRYQSDAGFVEVSLNGSGVARSLNISVTPGGPLNFTTPSGAQTDNQVLQITNNGNITANFSTSYSGDAARFSASSGAGVPEPLCLATIAPGASCNIAVYFTGQNNNAPNDFTAALNLVHSDPLTTAGTADSKATVTLNGHISASVLRISGATNFGSIPVGNSSMPMNVTLTNDGDAAITSLSVIGSAEYALAPGANSCAALPTLASHASCDVAVIFTPSARGTRAGSFTVMSSANNAVSGSNSIALTGVGLQGVVSLSGAGSFSDAVVSGAASTSTFTITNTGDAALSFSGGISASGDFSVTGGTCSSTLSSVAGSNTCSVIVSFNPVQAGARNGTLTINSNGAVTPVTRSLSANGIATNVSLTQTQAITIPDTVVGHTSAPQTMTFKNNGNIDLALGSLSVTPSLVYLVGTNTCVGTLATGQSCNVSISFKPTVVGANSGSISLATTPANSLTVALSGVGLQGLAQLSTPTAFADTVINASSAPQTIVLTNSGTATLNISSIVVSGEFTKAAATTCGSTLAAAPAANTCNIVVTFTPTSAGTGARNGAVTVNSDSSGGSSINVPLTGRALALSNLELVANGGTGTGTLQCNGGVCASTYPDGTALAIIATPALSSNFVSFSGCDSVSGNTCNLTMSGNESITATFTLRQLQLGVSVSGNGSVTGGGINCSAGNAGTCSANYAYASPVTLTAVPSTLYTFTGWTGDCTGTGTCSVTLDAEKNVQAVFAPVPQISVGVPTPSADFGNQQINSTSTAATMTVTSSGTAAVTLTSIGVTGDFAQSNDCPIAPATLAVGSSCEISLTFTPTALGARVGSLAVVSNGGSSSNSLLGFGANSIPTLFSFTSVTNADVDSTQTSNEITVSGTNINSSISIDGGMYSIDGAAYTSADGVVPPGAKVKLRVEASGDYSTVVSATLNIGGVSASFSVQTKPKSSTVTVKRGGGALGPWIILVLGLAAMYRRLRFRAALKVLLPLLFVSVSSVAKADDSILSYYGVAVGSGWSSDSASSIGDALQAQGYAVSVSNVGRRKPNVELYAGFKLVDALDVEFGFLHANQKDIRIQGVIPTPLGPFVDTAASAARGIDQALRLTLAYKKQIAERWTLEPRIGAIYWMRDVKIVSGNESARSSDAGAGLHLGAGLQYQLWRQLFIGPSVDYYRISANDYLLIAAGRLQWGFSGF